MESNQVILVTGANIGLGFQIIRALYSSSTTYTLLLGSRSLEKASKAIRDAVSEFPSSRSSLIPIQIDIEDDDSISAAFADIQSKYGRLDALVNNAGKQLPFTIPMPQHSSNTPHFQVLNSTNRSLPGP
jgi:NAD(P)-dependent dehydrogenase (short-subunit alcohol dehydrogenase family)